MPPVVITKSLGLMTHPNRLALPPGSQTVCKNTVHLREGVTSRRRGFKRYGTVLSNPASVVSEFLSRVILLDGTTLKYDSDLLGTWIAWTGAFSPPTNVRMRFLETAGNLYFTTSRGVYTADALGGTPARSGTPQGLDTQLSLVGTGGGWFGGPSGADAAVGYRITWTHSDLNLNAKQGAPSRQERIVNPLATLLAWTRVGTVVTITYTAHGFVNGDIVRLTDSSDITTLPAGNYTISNVTANTFDVAGLNVGAVSGTVSVGKAMNVSLTFTIPDDIQVGDEYRVWRTDLAPTANTAIGDDHRLITPLTKKVLAADITAGTITITDDYDDSFLGEDLYTNALVETLSQANDRPPLAKFIVNFEGHTFYFRAAQPHELSLQLLDIAGLVDGTSSITITSGGTSLVYTFAAAENIGLREFKRWTTETTIEQNIEKTVKSLEKVINRDTGNTIVQAYYASGEDDPSGKLRIEKKTLGTSEFSVIADLATTGDNFTPLIPISGTTVKSADNLKPHGYWRSKFGQPEAVPRLNFRPMGRQNKDTLGAVALKEAILVWKEDGLFTVSGQTDGASGANFVDDDLDPNAVVDGQNTLVVLDNAAFVHTLQGVLRAGQGMPVIHSRPQVETELRRLAQFANFATLAHAIPYETDREYILFTPTESVDTVCTSAFVYNYAGNTWDNWIKYVACGHVFTLEDRLYLGHATEPWILRERKSYSINADDFTDEDIDVTITAVGTANHPTLKIPGTRTPLVVSQITINYSYTEPIAAGFLLSQGAIAWDWADLVEDLGAGSYRLTLRELYSGWVMGAATVGLPIPVEIEWAPITGGDPQVMKQIPFCTVYPETGSGTHRLGLKADTQNAFEFVRDFLIERESGFGLGPWGEVGWGDEDEDPIQTLRTWVPINHQKCRALSVKYQNNYARESVDILSVGLDLRPFSTKNERRPR